MNREKEEMKGALWLMKLGNCKMNTIEASPGLVCPPGFPKKAFLE